MKKKIFCFVLIFYILFLNCIPCFALETFIATDFQNISTNINNINNINNSLQFKYVYYFQLHIYWGNPSFVVACNSPLDYEIVNDKKNVIITNNNSESVNIQTVYWDQGITTTHIDSNSSLSPIGFGGGSTFEIYGLLIQDGDCINKDFCSSDVYVDPSSLDDYNEDGVIIKGLIGFFSKIEKSINSISDKILKGLEDLIGLPPEGYFGNKFSEIKTNFDNKYNLGSMFDLFSSMKNIQPLRPTFEKTFTLKIGDLLDKTTGKKVFSGFNISIPFKINFDFIDGIKEYLFLFMRAFGYFYLVIYNMNQYYLLFRGQRFFYDMRESYHYKDSEGKEHNHERGDKKWY